MGVATICEGGENVFSPVYIIQFEKLGMFERFVRLSNSFCILMPCYSNAAARDTSSVQYKTVLHDWSAGKEFVLRSVALSPDKRPCCLLARAHLCIVMYTGIAVKSRVQKSVLKARSIYLLSQLKDVNEAVSVKVVNRDSYKK